ncbi:MAG: NAD-dependent epimerase/dehydratase family protein [Actinomycetota bacterium]
MSKAATVLVVGGGGFIGSVTCRQLLERGWNVRILDNFSRSSREQIEAQLPGAEIHEGDIRYVATVDRAMRGADELIHLAATSINKSSNDPAESLDIDFRGMQHVFESACNHGIGKVVFASSASVYGEPKTLPMTETDEINPRTPYCIGKFAGERMLAFYAERQALRWVALRFFNVYGPGQNAGAYYTSVVLTFLRRIARGEPPVIDGDGTQTMDFVHVEDVARAVVMALEGDASGEVLNVGTGTQTSIAELATILIRHMGAGIQPQFWPRDVLVSRREADITRIRSVLGWEPTVGLEEGLASVIEHLKAKGELA